MFEYERKVMILLACLLTPACQSSTDNDGGVDRAASFITQYGDIPNSDAPSSPTLLSEGRRRGPTLMQRGSGKFIGRSTRTVERSAAERLAEGVTLNIAGVPIAQAAKAVLGDIFSVRYTIDPAIEGRVTIQTPKPVSKGELVALFEAALRANGAVVVNNDGMYRIVPIERAALNAPVDADNKSEELNGLGSRVHAVQLKYVSASEIRRVLEPIVPRGSIVRADDARSLIMLSGSDQEIANTLDTIALFDIDVMKGMSFAIFPVTSSEPDAMVDELRSVFGTDRDGPTAGMIRFLPNKRLNAILAISPQPAYLSRAELWVRKLDARAAGSEKQFFTIAVQNRRAQDLVEVVQAFLSQDAQNRTGGASGRNVSPRYREARIQSPSNSFGPGQSAFPASGFSGNRSDPSDGGGSASQIDATGAATENSAKTGATNAATEGTRIKVVADDAKNAILVEATLDDYKRVARLIENLDVMPTQVLIEATIAEVSLNDELRFGVRWFLTNNKGSTFTFSDAATGAVSSVFPGFSYALTAAKLTATLNALNAITDINVISSPTLTAMDRRTAYLQIGDQVPITTQSSTGVSTAGAPIVNSITYKDTGVILSITPRINGSGRVLLDIEQEVSTVGTTTTSGIDSPTIHQRRIKTSVAVNNGEGLVLGGIIQEGKTISRSQIPIVGDFPVLGNAFRLNSNSMNKTELIVLITPHVMRNLSEASAVTDEFRKQLYSYSRRDHYRPRTVEQTVRRIFK